MATVNQRYLVSDSKIFSPICSAESVYYNNESSPNNGKNVNEMLEDMNRKNKQCCYMFSGDKNNGYTSGSIIPFAQKVYDTTNGAVSFGTWGGEITINHTGFIKVSVHVWLNCNDSARPWVLFHCPAASSKEYPFKVIDIIDDSNSTFNTYDSGNRIIPVNSGDKFQVIVWINNGTYRVNYGTDAKATYITIELM